MYPLNINSTGEKCIVIMESVSGEISLLTDPFTHFDHLAESDFTQSDFCYDMVHVHMC